MPIEMPRGLPFSVDTWSATSSRKRHHFLTHAHKDHSAGIAANGSYPIYSSRVTKAIVSRQFPQVEGFFVEIEVGESVAVHDPDGDFTVTALDANHCPGALMFLFEGEFGNILHTGDCRLGNDCLQNLPPKYVSKKGHGTNSSMDYLFLDCTFSRCPLQIPCKQSAIQQVINCIWKHPSAPTVYLACDLLGQEEILLEVFRTFGSKIYVDRTTNSDFFESLLLTAPDIISEDASSRFQVIQGFPRLYERASKILTQARCSAQPQPIFIRPSAQWFACDESLGRPKTEIIDLCTPVIDEFGVWHVCYSMHSSKDELESALGRLQPKWVISTTPPCQAMELEYVKKYCFKTKIGPDDPLWRLFSVGGGKTEFSSPPISKPAIKMQMATRVSEILLKASVTTDGPQDSEPPVANSKQFDLCSGEKPITLFGRARLNLQDWDAFHDYKVFNGSFVGDCKESNSYEDNLPRQLIRTPGIAGTNDLLPTSQNVSKFPGNQSINLPRTSPEDLATIQDLGYVKPSSSNEVESALCLPDHKTELLQPEKLPHLANELERTSSRLGSSKQLSDSLRKMYRSKNVPVPQPLPSLCQLIDVAKRARIRS